MFSRLTWGEAGQGLTEYGLLLGLIALIALAALASVGSTVSLVSRPTTLPSAVK